MADKMDVQSLGDELWQICVVPPVLCRQDDGLDASAFPLVRPTQYGRERRHPETYVQ